MEETSAVGLKERRVVCQELSIVGAAIEAKNGLRGSD